VTVLVRGDATTPTLARRLGLAKNQLERDWSRRWFLAQWPEDPPHRSVDV